MSDAFNYEPNVDEWFEFSDGEITVGTSAFMSDTVTFNLKQDQTRKLYEAMKEYYENE